MGDRALLSKQEIRNTQPCWEGEQKRFAERSLRSGKGSAWMSVTPPGLGAPLSCLSNTIGALR